LLVLSGAGCARVYQDDGVATASGTTELNVSASASAGFSPDPQRDQESFLQFAKCMREHGVPMEDPQLDGGRIHMLLPEGVDKETAKAAHEECRKLLPNGGEPIKIDPETQEKMRQFAQCMRENGVPNFPDPGEGGGIMIDGNKLGIDPRSEEFKKAEEACAQYRPMPRGSGEPETHTTASNA
jgi:hypothetical protein